MENDHLPRSVLWQGTEVWLSSPALRQRPGHITLALPFPTCMTLSKLLEFLVHQLLSSVQ